MRVGTGDAAGGGGDEPDDGVSEGSEAVGPVASQAARSKRVSATGKTHHSRVGEDIGTSMVDDGLGSSNPSIPKDDAKSTNQLAG